jgi:hypothetical protein
MGRPARRSSLPCVRWLLPVMLVLGVWGMHTLGHLAPHHGEAAMAGPRTVAAHAEQPAHDSGASLRLDPTGVCLAVLSSFPVLVIAVKRAGARPWLGEMAARTLWVGGVARSPPRRLALTLARLSVMRT